MNRLIYWNVLFALSWSLVSPASEALSVPPKRSKASQGTVGKPYVGRLGKAWSSGPTTRSKPAPTYSPRSSDRRNTPKAEIELVVKVLDERGYGLAGARVTFVDTETRTVKAIRPTDASGRCSAFLRNHADRYLVTASLNNYQFDVSPMRVTLREGLGTLYFKVTQRPKATIGVNVRQDGRAIRDVRVKFKNTLTGRERWAVTNQQGWCRVDGGQGIKYAVTPESNRYRFEPRTALSTNPLSINGQGWTFQASSITARYEITAVTSNAKLAGTDSNITVQLRGENGDTKVATLDDTRRDDFNRGQQDRFSNDNLELADVGNLAYLTVKSDGEHGFEFVNEFPYASFDIEPKPGDPGWLPEGFFVRNLTTRNTWYFPCHRWIYSTQAYGSVDDQSYAGIPKRGDGARSRTLRGYPQMQTDRYEIKVYTGSRDYAGTDATVYLAIRDRRPVVPGLSSQPKVVLDDERDNFEKNSVDKFVYRLPRIGAVESIRISHDNYGDNAGWFLHKVEICELAFPQRRWTFPCDRWIEKGERSRANEWPGIVLRAL